MHNTFCNHSELYTCLQIRIHAQNQLIPEPNSHSLDAPSGLAAIFGETDFSSLADDSVSDLLEQVEANEKGGELESPAAIIEWDNELTEGAITDCFGFANALSPMLDGGKCDTLTPSSDLHFVVPQNLTS